MRVMVKRIAFAGAFLVLTGTAAAADGIQLVMKTTVGGGPPQTHQVQIDGRRMRSEGFGDRGEKQIVVFDGAKKVMMLIDERLKTYIEVTEEEAETIGGKMSGMMARMRQEMQEMQEQMQNLPSEQRAQFEAMMKGRGVSSPGGRAPTRIQYTKTGTGTVGKWICDKYEGSSGGQKVSDVCAVDPKALGLTAADFEVSRALAAFFRKLMPAGGPQLFSIGTPADQGFSGVPVRSVSSSDGRQVITEITEVSRQTFPDSMFQPPAGYQKTSTGGPGRP